VPLVESFAEPAGRILATDPPAGTAARIVAVDPPAGTAARIVAVDVRLR
jgi:hypothetical protein